MTQNISFPFQRKAAAAHKVFEKLGPKYELVSWSKSFVAVPGCSFFFFFFDYLSSHYRDLCHGHQVIVIYKCELLILKVVSNSKYFIVI